MSGINKIIKRIISIAMLLLAISLGSTNCFAEATPQIVLSADYDLVNNQVVAEISIANNPGVVSLKLSLNYDSSVLSLTSIEDSDLLKGAMFETTDSGLSKNPYTLLWMDYVNYKTSNCENGLIATLAFDVAESYSGPTSLSLSVDSENTRNAAGDSVTFAVNSASVSVPKYVIFANYDDYGKMIFAEIHIQGMHETQSGYFYGLDENYRPIIKSLK